MIVINKLIVIINYALFKFIFNFKKIKKISNFSSTPIFLSISIDPFQISIEPFRWESSIVDISRRVSMKTIILEIMDYMD